MQRPEYFLIIHSLLVQNSGSHTFSNLYKINGYLFGMMFG